MANKKKKRFTGTLVLNQRRDVLTLSPKVLLVDVKFIDELNEDGSKKEFRQHVWVHECKRIHKVATTTDKRVFEIVFEAEVVKYKGSDGITKKGLQKLVHVLKAD